MKTYLWRLLLLAGLLVALAVAEYWAPRPQNWSPTLSKDDRIPYGTYALYQLLPTLLGEHGLRTNTYSFYEADSLFDGYNNLLLLARSYADMDSISTALLLQHVQAGGYVFIGAQFFPDGLMDSLKLAHRFSYRYITDSTAMRFDFVAHALRSDSGYHFARSDDEAYFVDTLLSRTEVLGRYTDGRPNFVRRAWGHGAFLVHSQPLLFTNYHLLRADNARYVSTALSFLPPRPTVWDEYYHPNSVAKQTLLRYILQQPALRAAWLLLLLGLLLYVVFGGKRLQRIIPLHRPPTNNSLAFVHTIARLYFQRRDNKNLAQKRFAYLLEHLRSHHYVAITSPDAQQALELAHRFDLEPTICTELFATARQIDQSDSLSDDGLMHFSRLIEAFRAKL